MYERFTDRARKVMLLADQEAQRFNHEYIGTEHILLGLVKEGGGVASYVLRNLNVDLRKIRLEVEKLVQVGPEIITKATLCKLVQTPRAKKVIEYSMEAARDRNNNYVGTEHLLLGLLRENDGVAAKVLTGLGVTLDVVLHEFALIGDDPVDDALSDKIVDTQRVCCALPQMLSAVLSIWRDIDSQRFSAPTVLTTEAAVEVMKAIQLLGVQPQPADFRPRPKTDREIELERQVEDLQEAIREERELHGRLG